MKKNYESNWWNSVPWSVILKSKTNHAEILKGHFKSTLTKTAQHLGVSRDALTSKLEKENIEFSKTKTHIQKIKDIGNRTKLMRPKEIGEEVGCSEYTARRICYQNKIEYLRIRR